MMLVPLLVRVAQSADVDLERVETTFKFFLEMPRSYIPNNSYVVFHGCTEMFIRSFWNEAWRDCDRQKLFCVKSFLTVM